MKLLYVLLYIIGLILFTAGITTFLFSFVSAANATVGLSLFVGGAIIMAVAYAVIEFRE